MSLAPTIDVSGLLKLFKNVCQRIVPVRTNAAYGTPGMALKLTTSNDRKPTHTRVVNKGGMIAQK